MHTGCGQQRRPESRAISMPPLHRISSGRAARTRPPLCLCMHAGNHSSPGRLQWASLIRVVEYQMSSGSDGRSPTGATEGRMDRLRLVGGSAAGGDSGDHGGDSGSAGGDAASIVSLGGDDVSGRNMPDRGPGPGSRVDVQRVVELCSLAGSSRWSSAARHRLEHARQGPRARQPC